MKPRMVRAAGADLALFSLDGDSPTSGVELIWAHGWGHTHQNMLALAQAMRRSARSTLIDLPGFGASPPPPFPWSTADYADAIAEWFAAATPSPASGGGSGWGLPAAPAGARPHPNPPPLAGEGTAGAAPPPVHRIWVAHSFGCRVGLQLAARHPEMLDGLFLIAAAGLPPHRTAWARGRMAMRRWAFRMARLVTPEGPARDRLRARFGSADYRAAGPVLRSILVKAVNEDLSAQARAVRVPAVLVVGDQDRDTPPELAMRLDRLMPQSRLVVLRGFDHLNVLTDGHHQIIQRLTEFLEQLA